MKKYHWILIAAVLVLIAGLLVPNVLPASVQSVQIDCVQTENVDVTATVTGEIMAEHETEQKAERELVVEKVLVTAGDFISKNDPVLKIDIDKTKQNYLNSGVYDFDPIDPYVYANVSGTISLLQVTDDQQLLQNDVLFTVIEPKNLQLALQIGEENIANIKTGAKLTFTGSGFENTYAGEITAISAQAKSTGTATVVQATAEIKNADSSLKPGFNVKAKVIIQTIKDAIVLPYSAIVQNEKNEEYVYVIDQGTAKMREIKTGDAVKNGIIIQDGLQKGEYYVINPSSLSGDEVAVKEK